ncbi:P-loop containing nucleoside triphosphate hydrolase protein [Aspergillus heteromorphus CBS 117.55]|uniref:P-loop containing nucleoside triphosphate hydrolase protein n=1 Tax=Aspergillus heteromorphus CBS 117.55 TaxID=1448321 RepID=A0A317WHZ4_9EURO|nr:P-loop containing nucleoside triphosphate hydrolase protein [Aspergillus heteromorphus CBS 117.55]PWY85909.1 P-loop containing nucleoside triphosphate hydrolase protein [Aspergillus heteromorphus CBS 117.55]
MKWNEDISLKELPKSPSTESTAISLSDLEKDILDKQLRALPSTPGFFGIYRYATGWDIAIIIVSSLASIAGGAALPLFTVLFGNLTSTFQDIVVGTITYEHFHSELNRYVVYFIYLAIAEFLTIYIATAGFIYTGDHVVQRIRIEYLRAILRQNIAFFDNLGAGEITTRITADTNLIQDGISEKVGLALTGLSTFVTAFLIAYIKYWKLALICSATLIALLVIMGGGSMVTTVHSKRALECQGQSGSFAEDILDSVRTVVAFDAQEVLARKYDGHLQASEGPARRAQITFAIMVGAMLSCIHLNYSLGFWRGSIFLVHGDDGVQAGDILTILMAIMLGSYHLGNVAPNSQAISTAVAAASKLYGTIDRPSPLDASSELGLTLQQVKGNIVLQNIRHVYPSRPEVIVTNDLSVYIPAGKTTAFVGPSGSGKSTVIGLIERFYNPVAGRITLDGHDLQHLNLRWLRQQVALVSQEPRLFAATIYENIRFGLIGSGYEHEPEARMTQRIHDAARMANAHDFIMALPARYETNIGSCSLSGGQKQRIAIARAVVKDPRLLLLDEATSALDAKSEEIVQAALDKASQGRTTIVIAHRLATIQEAHNIVVLVNGHIVEQGPHGELMGRQGVYRDMVEAQQIKQRDAAKRHESMTFLFDDDHLPPTEDLLDDDASDIGLKSGARRRHRMTRMSLFLPQLPSKKKQTFSLWALFAFLASFNRPEWPIMILGLAASIVAGGIQPSQAVLFAKAVNTLSLPPTEYPRLRHEATFWSLMFLMMGCVTLCVYSFQGTLFAYSSERMIFRARSQAFRAMLQQDISFFDREENTTGALTSTLSAETKQLAGISGVTLGTILIVTVNLAASLVVALVMGWKLALVCMSAVPVLLMCGFIRVWMLDKIQRRAKSAYQRSASSACEAASAIRTVASLTMEREVIASYESQLTRQLRGDILPILKSSALYASSQALPFLCMALGFWYGGSLLGRHEYTVFQFYVCFSEVIFGSQAAGTIFSHAPDMGKAKNAAVEFKKLFASRSLHAYRDGGVHVSSMQGEVEFRDVSFRYPTRLEQPVLRHLNITVKPGQYVALVGSSGSGKSTTIALLERFYDPQVGEVYVDGRNITTLEKKSYRSHLALVSQEPSLFHGTIRENILLGCTERENVPESVLVQACKDANIYDFIMSLPQGFHTLVGNKGGMLSGGQKQRIAIARALIRNPRILLLDEATSALDSESEKVVQAALDKAAKGRTTIAVAHRLSTIQRADMIYFLEQGEVVEAGSHKELLRKRGRYYEMVNLQNLK